jgi:transcriptional regulator with XRE-family HTH domain
MRSNLLPALGDAIRAERRRRGLTQTDLAFRLGRATPRISEFESDLKANHMRRDRLTLLAEICDALDLVLILAPRNGEARQAMPPGGKASSTPEPSAFDELFVDLSDGHEEDAGG